MNNREFVKEQIVAAAMSAVQKNGVRFTVDELAATLGMAKKTIYAIFPDKEALLNHLVEVVFTAIAEAENEVIANEELSVKEKLLGVLSVLPNTSFDYSQVALLRKKFPKVYRHLEEHIEGNWEKTLNLLDRGIAEGVFLPIDHRVFQLTYEAAVERFLNESLKQETGLSYEQALQELSALLVRGISKQ